PKSDPDGPASRGEKTVLFPDRKARTFDGLEDLAAEFLPIFELRQAAAHRLLFVDALRERFFVCGLQLLGELLDDFVAAPVGERQGSQFFADDFLPIRHVGPPWWNLRRCGARRWPPQCD